MTRPAKLAWTIIALSLVTWSVTWALPETWYVVALRHACEGGFVGGICDAFAIWKVYTKIEDSFDRITEEVSTTVVSDMVKPEQIVAELSAKLSEPAFARQPVGRIEALVPDPGSVRTFVGDVWEETLEERVVDWLVGLDLREAFDPPDGTAALTRSPLRPAAD